MQTFIVARCHAKEAFCGASTRRDHWKCSSRVFQQVWGNYWCIHTKTHAWNFICDLCIWGSGQQSAIPKPSPWNNVAECELCRAKNSKKCSPVTISKHAIHVITGPFLLGREWRCRHGVWRVPWDQFLFGRWSPESAVQHVGSLQLHDAQHVKYGQPIKWRQHDGKQNGPQMNAIGRMLYLVAVV